MDKRVNEETIRVIALAAAGWIALLFAVPDWAADAVLGFGAFYAVLVVALDENVQATLANWIPGHRGNSRARDDITPAPVKPPAARRAAT